MKIFSSQISFQSRKENHMINISGEVEKELRKIIIQGRPIAQTIFLIASSSGMRIGEILQLFPEDVMALKSLKDLTIIKCNFKKLPDQLMKLKTLEKFSLSDNFFSPKAEEKYKLMPKRWKKEYEPWRKQILWQQVK